jgi:hypothetical protein
MFLPAGKYMATSLRVKKRYEKFEDIKTVIRNRKSKKDRQYNGKKKKNKQ